LKWNDDFRTNYYIRSVVFYQLYFISFMILCILVIGILVKVLSVDHYFKILYSGKVWWWKSLTCFEHLAKKFWRMNRFSQKKIIIVCRNLDGFSLANHRWFAKPAKLSCYTVHSYALFINLLQFASINMS